MKKFVAIATAGCMLMAVSAPAMAAPATVTAQSAQNVPTIGLRSRMMKRAATTAPADANKFLSNISDQDKVIVGSASLLALILGILAITGGDEPASS
jgi:hypothetical protein